MQWSLYYHAHMRVIIEEPGYICAYSIRGRRTKADKNKKVSERERFCSFIAFYPDVAATEQLGASYVVFRKFSNGNIFPIKRLMSPVCNISDAVIAFFFPLFHKDAVVDYISASRNVEKRVSNLRPERSYRLLFSKPVFPLYAYTLTEKTEGEHG